VVGCSNFIRPKDPTDSGPVDHPTKLIAKLRSTDRSSRHATLAALLHTSFHASALSSGRHEKRNHGDLTRPILQAIRDQIVACDPLPREATVKQISSYKEQLRCSIVATECLGNYVCYVNDDEESHEGAWFAGWILIFMQRIQDFIDCFSYESTGGLESTNARRPIYDMHVELAEKSVIAMVHLLERNPLAMDRLRVVQQPYRSNVLDIHGILAFLLQHSNSILTSMDATILTRRHIYQSIQLHAARCLHSIWDDNFDFIASFLVPSLWQKPGICDSATTLEILDTIILSTWNTLTDPRSLILQKDSVLAATLVTGLHACGACMAAWLTLRARTEEIPPLFDGCIPMCVQLVGRIIVNGSPDESFLWVRMKGLEGPLHTAHLEYYNEQLDTQLEENVLQHQHKKMESARSIARRLKQMKTSASSKALEINETGSKVATSYSNQSNAKANNHACPSAEQKMDHTGHWETIQMEWYDAVRPIELAVELIANWASPTCSGAINTSPTRMNDVDMGMEEDDAMMYAHTEVVKPSLPHELVAKLKDFQVSTAIRELFTFLTDWYKQLIDSTVIPVASIIILDSLGDLIFKTIAAIESCHTLDAVPESVNSAGELTCSTWNLLMSFLFDVRTVTDFAFLDLNLRLQSASTGAMVSLLRRMSQQPPNFALKEEDLAWVRKVFNDLLLMLDSKVTDILENPVFVRDVVCMMGIVVCSFPTSFSSADIFTFSEMLIGLTAPVVDQFLQKTKPRISVTVVSEILNVFMDVFSEDDFCTNVFDQMNVLLYFEQMIPVLKREMQWNRLHRPTDDNVSLEEMIEHCQETVVNATSFVKYKKDLPRK
jgi:hypothetical protein